MGKTTDSINLSVVIAEYGGPSLRIAKRARSFLGHFQTIQDVRGVKRTRQKPLLSLDIAGLTRYNKWATYIEISSK